MLNTKIPNLWQWKEPGNQAKSFVKEDTVLDQEWAPLAAESCLAIEEQKAELLWQFNISYKW